MVQIKLFSYYSSLPHLGNLGINKNIICDNNITVFYSNILVVTLIIRCVSPCLPPKDAHPLWLEIRRIARALRFRVRWDIIQYIGDGEKSSEEIYNYLLQKGEKLTKSGFYYHLSELKNAGIIEISGYHERGGGAPEKIWRVKTKQIVINLLETRDEEG